VEPDQPYTEREDIIVISDEAHRTQYGSLALNLRNALPNASSIGRWRRSLRNEMIY
jgi:type I restriction enzyme R subunit